MINIVGYWATIESYKIATRININRGILTALFVFKPVVTSILFYLCFSQKLKKTDIVSIALFLSIVAHTVLSSHNFYSFGVSDEFSLDLILAIMLMVLTIILLSVSNTLIKHYFSRGNSKRNVVIIISMVNFCISFPMTCYGLYQFNNGFEYTYYHLLIGTIGGLVNLVTSSLSGFVITHGKAGVAESAMQS